MNKIISFIILILIISSCDNSSDYYTKINEAPSILIQKHGDTQYQSIINDSLKINSIYKIDVKLSDDYNDQWIIIKYEPEDFDGDFIINEDKSEIQITPTTDRFYQLLLLCIDIYEKTDTAYLNLEVFKNIPPIANLEFSNVGDLFKFDFRDSYDGDWKFGGKIVEYELGINDIVLSTDKDVLFVDLDSQSTYIFKLKVKDNDGVWSNYTIKNN